MKNLNITKFLFLPLIASLSFTACSSDDDGGDEPAVVTKTKTQQLTEKKFRITADTYSYDGITVDEYQDPDLYEACDKDDFIKFNADNTGTYDEGATKCDAGDPQNFGFTWAFTSNETKLIITTQGFGEEGTILKLDDNTLQVQTTDVYDYDGDNDDETVVNVTTYTKF